MQVYNSNCAYTLLLGLKKDSKISCLNSDVIRIIVDYMKQYKPDVLDYVTDYYNLKKDADRFFYKWFVVNELKRRIIESAFESEDLPMLRRLMYECDYYDYFTDDEKDIMSEMILQYYPNT